MNDPLPAAFSAFWLGILTSVSPCPLAANIAAVSYIGRRLGSPRHVLLSGMFYTFGRTLAYVALAALIVASVLSIPTVAQALQKNMNKLLGPLLIVAGLLLLEVIRLRIGGAGPSARVQAWADRGGVWGALALGFVFALTFCPVSAALFFGSLIPLSLAHGSNLGLPTLYGVGTGLPVFVFAVLVALGARQLSATFNRVTVWERWARRLTGIVFIGVGLYYIASYWFGVSI